MYISRKKTFITILSLAVFTGCGAVNPGVQNTTTSGFEQTSPAGLKFSKVSDQNATLLNNSQQNSATSGQAVSDTATSAPQASPVAPSAVSSSGSGTTGSTGAVKSNMSYFPSTGPFEEYVMINFEESKTSGFTGTYLETLTKVVKPIITAWSTDAKQTNINGTTDPNGKNINVDQQNAVNDMPYYYSPYQWQFTYISVPLKEVYTIFVSSKETLVLRQKWVIKDLNSDEIKIDSNQAIKIVTDKIMDKNYISPDNQDKYASQNSEILYSIPEKATWYFYLSQEKEGLIWNVNINSYNTSILRTPAMSGDIAVASAVSGSSAGSTGVAVPTSIAVQPQSVPYVYYSGGYARINAKTGELLSLSRPMKYTQTYSSYPSVNATSTAASPPPDVTTK